MALGCAFIFIIVIWCCRRRYRKRKTEERRRVQAYAFADTSKRAWWRSGGEAGKNSTTQPYHSDLDSEIISTDSLPKDKSSWKWRFIHFGEKLFCHSKSKRVYPMELDRTARNGNTTALLSDPLSYSRSHETSAGNGYDYTPDRDRDSRVSSLRDSLRPLRSHNEHPLDVPIDVDGQSSDHHGDTSAVRHADHQKDTPPHRTSLIQGPTQSHPTLCSKNEEQDMVQLISSYRYTATPQTPLAAKVTHFHHDSESSASTPSNGSRNDSSTPLLPRLYYEYRNEDKCYRDRSASRHHPVNHYSTKNHQPQSSLSTDSMYSSLTGHTRRMPDARQPVRDPVPPVPELKSRFSMSSDGHHQAKRSKKFNKRILGNVGGLSWKKLLP